MHIYDFSWNSKHNMKIVTRCVDTNMRTKTRSCNEKCIKLEYSANKSNVFMTLVYERSKITYFFVIFVAECHQKKKYSCFVAIVCSVGCLHNLNVTPFDRNECISCKYCTAPAHAINRQRMLVWVYNQCHNSFVHSQFLRSYCMFYFFPRCLVSVWRVH